MSIRRPKISIITPLKNANQFIPDFIKNLKKQTFDDWECLMVDHNSVDGGADVLRALTKDDERFVLLEARSIVALPAIPRNVALRHAKGEYICFLDIDDFWHPQKLARQLAYVTIANLEICVTAYARHSKKRPRWQIYRCPPKVLHSDELIKSNPIPIISTMIKRSLLESTQFHAVRHEDYQLWVGIWKEKPDVRYGCLPEVLAFHQRHSSNLTVRHPRMLWWIYSFYVRNSSGVREALWRTLLWAQSQTARAVKERVLQDSLGLTTDELAARNPVTMG